MLRSSVASVFNKPILAPILEHRPLCVAITGATILHLILVAYGLPSWQSPVRLVFGILDPGGGLTRAILALFRGDWQTSLTFHAFGLPLTIALDLIALAAILPVSSRDKMAGWVGEIERRTGLTAILLIGFFIYWLVRLLILGDPYIELIVG